MGFLYLLNSLNCGNKEIQISDSLPYQKNSRVCLQYIYSCMQGENRNLRIFSGILPYQFLEQYVERFVGCTKNSSYDLM